MKRTILLSLTLALLIFSPLTAVAAESEITFDCGEYKCTLNSATVVDNAYLVSFNIRSNRRETSDCSTSITPIVYYNGEPCAMFPRPDSISSDLLYWGDQIAGLHTDTVYAIFRLPSDADPTKISIGWTYALDNAEFQNPVATPTTAPTTKPTQTVKPTPTAKPTPTSKPNSGSSTYRKGDSGSGVKKVQQKLKEFGYYSGSIDGDFGSGTERAVKKFQEHFMFTENGVVSGDTAKYLLNYSALNYSDFLRNPNNYKNAKLLIKGKVIQSLDVDSSSGTLLVATKSGYDDLVWVKYDFDKDGNGKILEGDKIEFFCDNINLYTYTTVGGSEKTVPKGTNSYGIYFYDND